MPHEIGIDGVILFTELEVPDVSKYVFRTESVSMRKFAINLQSQYKSAPPF